MATSSETIDVEKIEPRDSLSFWQKMGYGVGDVGPALTVTIQGFVLNVFLLDVAGIPPTMAAVIFLLVKAWDSVNDPIIGTLTDRTETRWGRRRPWLLFGAIPFALAWVLMWQVPDWSLTWLFVYYLVVAILLDTSMTAVNVPYTALTPEIAPGYDERTSLNTFRFSFSILGGMVALFVHNMIVGSAENIQAAYSLSALIMGVVILLSNWITFASTKERYFQEQETQKEPGFIEGFRIAFTNRPFVMVTGIYLISWLAIQFIQVNIIFFVKWVMGQEDLFWLVALVLQVSIFVFLIFWTKVSERIGKRKVYAIGVVWWMIMGAAIYFVQPGQFNLLLFLAVSAGAGAAVAYLIPWSMLPDVVDLDELNTGLRREGVYYGFFVFLQKLGLALGLAVSNFVLGIINYCQPDGTVECITQPDGVLLAFRLFISIIPAIILVFSLPIVYRYPITKKRHAEILAAIEAKRGQARRRVAE